MESRLSRLMPLFEGFISRVFLTPPVEGACTGLGSSGSGVAYDFFQFKPMFYFGMVLDGSRRCYPSRTWNHCVLLTILYLSFTHFYLRSFLS